MPISMFCTFLCFALSPFLPRTLSGQSNRLLLPPPKTEVITNTDQNTNTDTNTNTETSRDAIKPVSTSSTLNESDHGPKPLKCDLYPLEKGLGQEMYRSREAILEFHVTFVW